MSATRRLELRAARPGPRKSPSQAIYLAKLSERMMLARFTHIANKRHLIPPEQVEFRHGWCLEDSSVCLLRRDHDRRGSRRRWSFALADITTHRKEAVCRQPFGGREGVFAADGIFLSAVGCRCLAVRLTENIPWLKTGH